MTSYVPVIKNGAAGATFYVSLVSQANTKIMQASPTLAAGDVKISIDGGAQANLGTLPTNTPAASGQVKVTLSQAETNGDNLTIRFSDAAGAEWCDLTVNIQTAARQIDDLAFPTVSGRSIDVAATGEVGLDFNNVLSSALLTLNSLTVTGTVTFSDGLVVNRSSSNTSAIVATGNGTGHGISATSGSGATGNGILAASGSTNGHGLHATGTGTGTGLRGTGGATGSGITGVGGATSGAGINAAAQAGASNGITATGTNSGHGISATGGSTGDGLRGTSGSGATGNGITGLAASTNGHGMALTGTGTGDGLQATAGASGADIDADIAGTITTATSVTNGVTLAASAVQAIWDALTAALTTVGSIGKLLVDNINATVSSRASQTSVDDLPTNAELATALDPIPTANENADALFDRADAVETGWTLRQWLRVSGAVLFGKSSGHTGNAPVYRSITDAKNRVTATTTTDGRTAVTTDAT